MRNKENMNSCREYCYHNEYNKQTNIKEFHQCTETEFVQEYGSQAQSEFNEHNEQRFAATPKKSKFKRMVQYLVAGFAGAVIIYGNTRTTKSENIVANKIVIPLEYDTYTYTINSQNMYRISFDETKIDDFCLYLAEYIYKISYYIDEETYEELLRYASADNPRQLMDKELVSFDLPTNTIGLDSFGFGFVDDNGRITTGYQFVQYETCDKDNNGMQPYSFVFWVEAENDPHIKYLDDLIENYGGLSKEEIYAKLIAEYESYGFWYGGYSYSGPDDAIVYTDCNEWSVEFYLKNGTHELMIPTVLKIEKE